MHLPKTQRSALERSKLEIVKQVVLPFLPYARIAPISLAYGLTRGGVRVDMNWPTSIKKYFSKVLLCYFIYTASSLHIPAVIFPTDPTDRTFFLRCTCYGLLSIKVDCQWHCGESIRLGENGRNLDHNDRPSVLRKSYHGLAQGRL